VGCGRIAPKSQLVRIALIRGPDERPRAVLDRAAKLPGRGAYLCRDMGSGDPLEQCLTLARRNRGVARTLRATVAIDGELLESVGR
jgi:predicted RNA-binding protein YlxR (DUF448 family)